MNDKLFNELESNLGKAVRYAKGEASATEYLVLSPADIKAIRLKLKMSQAKFAREF